MFPFNTSRPHPLHTAIFLESHKWFRDEYFPITFLSWRIMWLFNTYTNVSYFLWTDVNFCLLFCELPKESVSKDFLTYLFFKYLSKTFRLWNSFTLKENTCALNIVKCMLVPLLWESFTYVYVIFSNCYFHQ